MKGIRWMWHKRIFYLLVTIECMEFIQICIAMERPFRRINMYVLKSLFTSRKYIIATCREKKNVVLLIPMFHNECHNECN